jgi:hypothetical protein
MHLFNEGKGNGIIECGLGAVHYMMERALKKPIKAKAGER